MLNFVLQGWPLLQGESGFLSPDLGAFIFIGLLILIFVAVCLQCIRGFEAKIKRDEMPSRARGDFNRVVILTTLVVVVLMVTVWIFREPIFIDLL